MSHAGEGRRRHGGPFTHARTHTGNSERLHLLDDINFLASKEEGGIPGREKGAQLEGNSASVRV